MLCCSKKYADELVFSGVDSAVQQKNRKMQSRKNDEEYDSKLQI